MKKTILFTVVMGLLTTEPALAENKHIPVQSVGAGAEKMPPAVDLTLAEYVPGPLECTVMEVAIQYESAANKIEFHCIEDPNDPVGTDGMIFELEGLPPDFEEIYRNKLNSGRPKLRAEKIYRLQHKLIFTEDTVWSIAGDSN